MQRESGGSGAIYSPTPRKTCCIRAGEIQTTVGLGKLSEGWIIRQGECHGARILAVQPSAKPELRRDREASLPPRRNRCDEPPAFSRPSHPMPGRRADRASADEGYLLPPAPESGSLVPCFENSSHVSNDRSVDTPVRICKLLRRSLEQSH